MNKNEAYYGSEENTAISYLEFGSVDIEKKSKKIWGYWQDQEAYDLYMFARYARDLFAFREFEIGNDFSVETLQQHIINSAHDKILDYVFKYAGLITQAKLQKGGFSVCESGSSLYGLIDEVVACDLCFNEGKNIEQIKHAVYIASDLSELMNRGAKAFHPEAEMYSSVAPTISLLVDDINYRIKKRISLFYGLSVSMRYALRETADLLKLMGITDMAIFNRLSLSKGKSFSLTYGTGKTVYIVSLPELVKGLAEIGCRAWYCQDNMQFEKDGKNSLRASIVIGHNAAHIENFINIYNECVLQCEPVIGNQKNVWEPLDMLVDLRG